MRLLLLHSLGFSMKYYDTCWSEHFHKAPENGLSYNDIIKVFCWNSKPTPAFVVVNILKEWLSETLSGCVVPIAKVSDVSTSKYLHPPALVYSCYNSMFLSQFWIEPIPKQLASSICPNGFSTSTVWNHIFKIWTCTKQIQFQPLFSEQIHPAMIF